jgi:hypothetical protein
VPAIDRFTGFEHTAEDPLGVIGDTWHDFTHGATQVSLERYAVHRRRAIVQAEVA